MQQEATELLNGSWSTLPEETQIKLQALGIGPEEPELTDILKTHMDALPPQVQQIVTKLTAPEPCTERDIATKLKGQVTDLKAMSIRKNQLQEKSMESKPNMSLYSLTCKSYKENWLKGKRHHQLS